ncbi:N-formylglutamate amidohydrolase [Parvularcula sp. ZS-1/3]|uniref:N-formylglutamate amidohydrolase n=1 Tax=Parvularcula mediterranea TaxID=2732508 RepID=A0A7Y3RMG2_9PROT|nr:N-formylglutamate amidohydrolase [Parvularcula mediterranea]NNU16784.1 N-formylglutamate amidohydrolase [Parvularcula mediterranea]
MVARIVKDNYPGHVLTEAEDWRQPYIFCCPHAGRDYPRKLLGQSPLPLETLRRSEDAYVDQLIPRFATEFAPVLEAKFPRLFVDVNRSPGELDPSIFQGQVEGADEFRSSRVVAGFGVIPKLAADGRTIYRSRLPNSEAKARLKNCFQPYHDALRSLVAKGRKRFGRVVVVDWHSMPSSALANGKLHDIVLGDLHGVSCDPREAELWQEAFAAEGFSVARNAPYAGGYVAGHYGSPDSGVSVLQIEINRRLYMDERRVARSRDFHRFTKRIEQVVDRVVMARAPGAVAAE